MALRSGSQTPTFSGWDTNAILTVRGVDIADTRAAGSALQVTNDAGTWPDNRLLFEQNVDTGVVNWVGGASNVWDMTTANWDTDTSGLGTSGQFLSGDAVYFDTPSSDTALHEITIADSGVALAAHGDNQGMEINKGKWSFSGGKIEGGAILISTNRIEGPELYFDTRAMNQQIQINNTLSGGDASAITLSAAAGHTLTFQGMEEAISNAGNSIFNLGMDDGTLVFNANGSAFVNQSGYLARLVLGNNISLYSSHSAGVFHASNLLINGQNTFINNSTAGNGAVASVAFYDATFQGDVYISSGTSTFYYNSATGDGGVFFAENRAQITGGSNYFDRNSADGNGGVMFGQNEIIIKGGTNYFMVNRGVDGGALYTGGSAEISGGDNYFGENEASGRGGALYAAGAVTVSGTGGTDFVENHSGADGGAIYAAGDLTISGGDINFYNNVAANQGGAIYAAKNATIVASGGDVTFRGNWKDGAITRNALYAANTDTNNTLTLAAAANRSLIFDDAVTSSSASGLTITIGGQSPTYIDYKGTVIFGNGHHELYGAATVKSGTMQLADGASFGVDKTGMTSFTLEGAATLLADATGSGISAGTITFMDGATIAADMSAAVNRDEAGATTNLILDTNAITIAADAKIAVDAINFSGVNGTYIIINATDINFDSSNLVAKINGAEVGGTRINDRYGLTYFDSVSETGKLLLVIDQSDIARKAAWQGGSGVWSETAGNWSLEGSPLEVFKNGDQAVFDGSDSADNIIELAATGTSTALVVKGLEISGSNNWTFSGADLIGNAEGSDTADFIMDGSGTVFLEMAATFDNYQINSGVVRLSGRRYTANTSTTVAGGGMHMLQGAALVSDKAQATEYVLKSGANLIADSAGNTIRAAAITLEDGAFIAADMTGAVEQGVAGSTTNLVLDTNSLNIAADAKITVDAINFSGVDGSYVIIASGSLNFDMNNLIAKVNGMDVGGGGVNERYGLTSFDSASETGKLLLVVAQNDSARKATWQGGSGVWSETAGNWALENSALTVFKNGDLAVFNGDNGADIDIEIQATGTSTALVVQGLEIGGNNNWSFSGDGLKGAAEGGTTADFVMNGSGNVIFAVDTAFDNYLINSGRIYNSAGNTLEGEVDVARGAVLENAGIINNDLNVSGEAVLALDSVVNGAVNVAQGASLSNAGSIAGDLTISGEAILAANSSVNGDVIVNGGALLGGTGTVNGLLNLHDGGALKPGHSIGTLTTGGLDLQAGSVTTIEVSETASDKIIVTAGGNAVIAAGANLVVDNETPGTTWSTDGRYVIIEVQGGGTVSNVFGNFDASALPFLTIVQELSDNNDQLILVSTYNAPAAQDIAETRNQHNVEQAIAALTAGNVVQNAIANAATAQEARAYLDGFSGEMHAGLSTAVLDHDRYLMRSLRSQIGSFTGPETGLPLWVSANGFASGTDKTGLSGKASYQGFDVALGAEARIMNVWQLGAVFRYTDGEYKVKSGRDSKAEVDSYTIGLYGGRDFELGPGALRFFLGATYGWHEVNSRRNINTGTLRESLKGDYSARSAQIAAELGYRLPVSAAFDVEPYVGVAWNTVKLNSFNEKGGAAALHAKGETNDNVSTSLGVRGEMNITERVSAAAGLSWIHTYGNLRHENRFNFRQDGAGDFSIKGAPLDRDAIGLGLDLKVKPTEALSVKLGYDGVVGGDVSSHAGKLTLTWEF